MKKRIFRSICLISLASLLLLCACVVGLVYQKSSREAWRTLKNDTAFAAAGWKNGGMDFLNGIKGYTGRITLVDSSGAVLFDDREQIETMQNHKDRPEITQAFANGAGRDQRQSDTLSERTLYYAQLLEDGNVLRLSMQAESISAQAFRFIPWLLLVFLLLIVAAAGVAKRQTEKIVTPINNINLDDPLEDDQYEELSPLLRRITTQKQQIDIQLAELNRRQQEFATITQSMDEGLILTDHHNNVLTINESAQRILEVGDVQHTSQPLLALSRNLALDKAAKKASEGKRVEDVIEYNTRQYRLVASPTRNENGKQGAVLLLMDDTEKLLAEQSRREFTANVSHELKTPLTSISGYAEIIRNGLVKPEDIKGFAGKIYDESSRLITLVGDIIKLSRLDEKQMALEKEPVDLLGLAKQTAADLTEMAAQNSVTVNVGGETIILSGVRTILSEILYNLTENAIRYNRKNGTVDIQIGQKNDQAVITVKDTGPGIPPEHQDHIFERFYRVDKSHSRDTGGTGLGLAIVKRGALYHNGAVELISSKTNGSRFIVTLPLDKE